MSRSLGQVAYEAYYTRCSPEPMPWRTLADESQWPSVAAAWQAAAEAVAMRVALRVDRQWAEGRERRSEYEPWVERGETELEYWKAQYLELAQENGRMQAVIEAAKAWNSACHPINTGDQMDLREAVDALIAAEKGGEG